MQSSSKSQCKTKQYILSSEIKNSRINLLLKIIDASGKAIKQFQGSASNEQMPNEMKNKVGNINNLLLFLNDAQNLTVNLENGQVNLKYCIKVNDKVIGSENIGSLKLSQIVKPQSKPVRKLQDIAIVCSPNNEFSMQQLKQILILLSQNLITTSNLSYKNALDINTVTQLMAKQQKNLSDNLKSTLEQISGMKSIIFAKHMMQFFKSQPIDENKANQLIDNRVKKLKKQMEEQISLSCKRLKEQISYDTGKKYQATSPSLLTNLVSSNPFSIPNVKQPQSFHNFHSNQTNNNYKMARVSTLSLRRKICQNQLFKNCCQITDEGTLRFLGMAPRKVQILGTQDIRKVTTFGFRIVSSKQRNIGFGVADKKIQTMNKDFNTLQRFNSSSMSYYESSTGRVFSGTMCIKKEGNGINIGQLVIFQYNPDDARLKVTVSGQTRVNFLCSGGSDFSKQFVPCIIFNDPGDTIELYQKAP